MAEQLKEIYKKIKSDSFPEALEISFISGKRRDTVRYEKIEWEIDKELRGLRYGENPCQEAALYKLVNGNLVLGQVSLISPGKYLTSDIEIIQSGKHPGKTNITDIDNALNILRYFSDKPTSIIVKHNNPCGVARAVTLSESLHRAVMADRIASFGGAIAVNRMLDKETAHIISRNYFEVVAAPDFTGDALDLLKTRKNLRILRINRIDRLEEFIGERVVDYKSLIDGGLVLQTSYSPKTLKTSDFISAETEYKGEIYRVEREATENEKRDLLFGWLVESGITSNSVIYVKDETTIGIGTGEQDRVGVAEIARDKAYKKTADRISFTRLGRPFSELTNKSEINSITEEVGSLKGGLLGSRMVSDAFFPFRDGIDVGLKEGVSAVIQPGGSEKDYESITACNEYKAAMVFTGQRSFKH